MSNTGQVKNFKIYVEADKVKNRDTLNNGTKGKSIPRNSGSYLRSANDQKNNIKNLEKSKTKPGKPEPIAMNANVGRKVLADIGNVKSSSSKTGQQKSYRLGKGKSDTMLYPQRKGKREMMLFPARYLYKAFSALSVPFTGQVAVDKNIKSTSDEPRTKFEGRSSAAATGRKSVRIPLHLTRKSLPVLKQVSRVETSGTSKENSEKSDNFRGKHGFPVKPSVRRSIVPKPSTLSSRPWGNRVSDGFVVMASRTQTKVDAGVLSRKSVKKGKMHHQMGRVAAKFLQSFLVHAVVGLYIHMKMSGSPLLVMLLLFPKRHICVSSSVIRYPTVKTITALNTQRNIKSNHTFSMNKLRSKPADLSKRKQDKASASKNVPSVVSLEAEEPAPEEDSSVGTIARRKSDRRNSFTCSLMSRSKMLKECSKVTSQETLPNIYDDRNHLEVWEYVDDIYHYYWVMEGQNPLLKNYMGIQRDITPQMRGILINWLVEVHLKFDLMEETLFLTVTLLDRYLSLESIKKNEMQLVGLTALLLASKYEDFWHPRVTDLISISVESYSRDHMLKMEKAILKKLKFRLNEPTPYVFMLRFLKAAQSDKKFECLAFYLIELCLVEYEALNYKPSMLCASAIYVARCTMQMTPPWTPLLSKHARYEESQMRDCADMILKFHKAAKTNLLKVTFEKYTKLDYCRVAAIKPLGRLPA
ncbi:hypothetical protein DH2020_017079 [Rehmannia glutinosa]|uniref:B-like cyclin n=1 Tax=Rehmannia glutinosa TaxID=99300 RepID=A0ABR0WTJ5_REHGL